MDSNKIDKEIKEECIEVMKSNLSDELKIKLISMLNNQSQVINNAPLFNYRTITGNPDEYKVTISSDANKSIYGDNNG